MPLAAAAFLPLQLGTRTQAHDHSGDHPQWDIDHKPADYLNQTRDVADQQIARAGYRLAGLLKQIWP